MIVLDRTVTRVFPTGARLTLTHNIIRVQDKDAIDKFGEVQIPADADVLTLRAIKADGTTREPEELAEKETISVPDLEPGDYVEFEYVDPASPPGAFPRGFLAERFFFRSYDAPLYRSEYVVAAPPEMKLQVDRRGEGVPEMRVDHARELAIYTFAHDAAAAAVPGAGVDAVRRVPAVGARGVGAVDAGVEGLSPRRAAARRARQPRARARRRRGDARRAQRRRQGARGRRVGAQARQGRRRRARRGRDVDPGARGGQSHHARGGAAAAAGVSSRIWLAHPERDAQLDGALPDLEGFDEPLLAAGGLWIDPRYRHAATGFVSPPLRGARAFALAPGPLQAARVPTREPRRSADGLRHAPRRRRLGAR